MKKVVKRTHESRLIVQRFSQTRNDWIDYWTGSPGDTVDWVETSIMPSLQRETPALKFRLVELVTESTTTFEVVA